MHVISYYLNSKTRQKIYFKLSTLLINLNTLKTKFLQVFTSETFLGGKIDFLLQKLVHVGGEV